MDAVNRPAQDVEITCEPIEQPDSLAPLWSELESRSDCSFFQSWGWIGCWLRLLPPSARPSVLKGRQGSELLCMAVLVPKRSLRHGFLRSNGLYLSETGDPSLDSLTVEYNGFLTDRGAGVAAVRQPLEWLVRRRHDWDELLLSGLADGDLQAFSETARACGLRIHVRARKPCDYVDLGAVERSGGDFLAGLSKNTRYQIRRSLRLYAADGEPSFRLAETVEEAQDFLARLKDLHQAYWTRRGEAGAFANPFFERFHRTLIGERFGSGEIQVARIAAGSRVIGYLYNFLHRGHLYAYQSGFAYHEDPKLKPGLVSHYLAIRHYLEQGAATYDFMAGDSQHKRSLGTGAMELTWLSLQRNLAKYRVEDALRAMKRRVLDGRGGEG